MALINEQVAEAQQAGGVTETASTAPNVPKERFHVAGLFTPFMKKATEVSPSVTRQKEGKAPALPTQYEEGMLGKGEYVERQKEAAEMLLSPEGQQRFEQAGGEAKTATELPVELPEGAVDADDAAATPTVGEVRAEQIIERGEKARRDFDTGAVPEGEAADLLEMYKERGIIIETENGIDFNFDRMEGGEDIQAVINAVSEIYEVPTEAAKRGIVTNEETKANALGKLADELGFTKEILRKKTGETLNAEDMLALRYIIQNSGKKLAALAERIEAGDNGDAVLLAFRKQMALHAALQMKAKGAQTEIARALQAFNIPAGPIDYGAAAGELIRTHGGQRLNTDLAKGYLKILREKGPTAANQFASRSHLSKAQGIFHEVYINGLLSWPLTAMKNLLGTPAFTIYNEIADLSAAGIGTVVRGAQRAMGGTPDPRGIYFSDIYSRWWGYSRAFKDAFIVGVDSFKSGTPKGPGKIDAGQLKAIDSETLGVSDPFWGGAIDWVGRVVRLPGDVLQGTDDFWKTILGRGSLWEEGNRQYRLSRAAGKPHEEALDDSMMVLIDPRSKGDEITGQAKYNTLTADIDNAVGELTRTVQGSFLGRLIVPFGKVPTNSIRVITENHPLAALVTPSMYRKVLGMEGPKVQQRALGRLATGTMLMYTMQEYASNGYVTGALPRDQKLRNTLPPGWQPYSFVLRDESDENPWPVDRDGNKLPLYNAKGIPNGPLKYVSYSGLEPVSAFIAIAADAVQRQHLFIDPEDREYWATASVWATVDYLKETPFLTGIGTVIKALEYQDFSAFVDNPLGNMYGPLPMPYSSLVRNLNNFDDPRIKKISGPLEYWTEEEVIAEHRKNIEEGRATEGDEIPYEMVGSPKTGPAAEFWGTQFNQKWLVQMKNNPWYQETEQDYQILLDPLGNELQRNVEFSTNPVQALWNSITPFAIKHGEELNPTQQELLRLRMPLTNQAKSVDGFKLPKYLQSDVAKLAKKGLEINGQKIEIRLPFRSGGFAYDFNGAIEAQMATIPYQRARDKQKASMLKRIEDRFYAEAFKILLAKPENADVRDAFGARNRALEMIGD